MHVKAVDHFVLTVRDLNATLDWYTRVLGMEAITFGQGRRALVLGSQKINLHAAGHEFEPKAAFPTPGSADFCLITDVPLADVMTHVQAQGAVIVEGPVSRTGAMGPLHSIYLRDPDGNLVEVANKA